MSDMAATHRHALRFAPTIDGMARAADDLRQFLTPYQLGEAARYNVELAFDEITANIVRHAGATDDVQVDVRVDQDEIVMRFEDNGVRFDPSERADPELPTSLDDARVGGLGILLVRQRATRLAYERSTSGRNVFTLALPAR